MKTLLLITLLATFASADTFTKSQGISEFSKTVNSAKKPNNIELVKQIANSKYNYEQNLAKMQQCENDAKTEEEKNACLGLKKVDVPVIDHDKMQAEIDNTAEFQKKLGINTMSEVEKVDISKFKNKLTDEDMKKIKAGI
jgi:hypothetical protein